MAEGRLLSLDDFAAITARLESGAPRDRVLAEADLTSEQWLEAQEMWLERMAKLAAKGRPQLHDRFRERLEAHQAEASLHEEDGPAGPMPRPPQAVVSSIARVPPPRSAQPAAPVAAAPFRVTQPPATRRPAATAMFSAVPSPAAALPFAAASHEVAGGGGSDVGSPFRTAKPAAKNSAPTPGDDGALPFRPSLAAENHALPFRSPDEAPAGASPQTASGRAASAPDEAPAGASPQTASGRAASPPAKSPLRATLSLPEISLDDVAALPFSPSPAAAPQGKQEGGLPFARSGAPEMTVEQYAWLCVALARAPERAAATLAWMKLSAADKDALDRHFGELFKRDGDALARFHRAMAEHEKGRGS